MNSLIPTILCLLFLQPFAPAYAQTTVDEVEPNNRTSEAQFLAGRDQVVVNGSVEATDAGSIQINFTGGGTDDLEDVFEVGIAEKGLNVKLDGFTVDCDIYLLTDNGSTYTIVTASNATGDTQAEEINEPELEPGVYLVGVTLYDETPSTATSDYSLTVSGSLISNAVAEVEPNNTPDQAQALVGESPALLLGTMEQEDTGGGRIGSDDLEDMFLITTTGTGLSLTLSRFEGDLNMYLLDAAGTQVIARATQFGSDPEAIDEPELPAGEYIVAITIDELLGAGQVTTYRLSVSGEFAGAPVANEPLAGVSGFALRPNYPNPFSDRTTIGFSIAEPGAVRLDVFDLAGRHLTTLVNRSLPSGNHQAEWNGTSENGATLPPGTYLYRLSTERSEQTLGMTIVR